MTTDAPAILLEDVTFAYPGGPPAVESISLRVATGEALALVGPNGAGKTTLLRLILGQLTPQLGRVQVCGMSGSAARRAGAIGYVPQRSEAELSFPLSTRQLVALGPGVRVSGWRALPAQVRRSVDEALRFTGADAFEEQPVGSLSGGQLQRALIARAIASEPRMLVLDEPTVGIDAAGQQRFSDLLGRLKSDLGLTVLLVTHDLRAVASGGTACDRIACLRKRLHYHDAPGGITPAVLAEVFQHDLAPIFGDVHVDAHRAADCPDPDAHAHRCTDCEGD
ncbi:MAG: metal ABC transporter ATP-binding protein [Planctomycetota bacterium]